MKKMKIGAVKKHFALEKIDSPGKNIRNGKKFWMFLAK